MINTNLQNTNPITNITFFIENQEITFNVFSKENNLKPKVFKFSLKDNKNEIDSFIEDILKTNHQIPFISFNLNKKALSEKISKNFDKVFVFDLKTIFKNANLKPLNSLQQIAYIFNKSFSTNNLELINLISQEEIISHYIETYENFIIENNLDIKSSLDTNSQLVEKVVVLEQPSNSIKQSNADFYNENKLSLQPFNNPILETADIFLSKQIFFPFQSNFKPTEPLNKNENTIQDIFLKTPYFDNKTQQEIDETIQEFGLDRNNQPSYKNNSNEFEILLENHGNPIVLKTGLGGIHGALNNFVAKDVQCFHVDVESLHPTTIIKNERFSTNFNFKKYESLYYERVFKKRLLNFLKTLTNKNAIEIKNFNFNFPFEDKINNLNFFEPIKKQLLDLKTSNNQKSIIDALTAFANQQASAKLVLVNTYGNFLNKHSAIYDVFTQRDIVYDGQRLMLGLIDKLEEYCVFTQVNTDAVDFIPKNINDIDKIHSIIEDFSNQTGYNFETDVYDSLFQTNVNDFLTANDKWDIQTKGPNLKEYKTISKLNKQEKFLDTPKNPIIAYAITERLLNNKNIDDILNSATNPILFSQMVETGSYDFLVKGEKVLSPTNRVFIGDTKDLQKIDFIYKSSNEKWMPLTQQEINQKKLKNNLKITEERLTTLKTNLQQQLENNLPFLQEEFLVKNFNEVNKTSLATSLEDCLVFAKEELEFINELKTRSTQISEELKNPTHMRKQDLVNKHPQILAVLEDYNKKVNIIQPDLGCDIPNELFAFFIGSKFDETKINEIVSLQTKANNVKKGEFSCLFETKDKINGVFSLDNKFWVKITDNVKVKVPDLPANNFIFNGDLTNAVVKQGKLIINETKQINLDLNWYKQKALTYINNLDSTLLTTQEKEFLNLPKPPNIGLNDKFNTLRKVQNERLEFLKNTEQPPFKKKTFKK